MHRHALLALLIVGFAATAPHAAYTPPPVPQGSWTSYTPTFTATGGSGVSYVLSGAAYQQVGKQISVRVTVGITHTTAPTSIKVSMPGNAAVIGGQSAAAGNVSTGQPNYAFTQDTTGVFLQTPTAFTSGNYFSVNFTGEMQ